MKRMALIMVTIGPLALAGGGGCSDDMMSMTDEIDRFAEHRAALEAEMTDHHREVLEAGGLDRIRSLEADFEPRWSGHIGEMDHRMRDMQGMCNRGGHRVDLGSMSDVMTHLRDALGDHRRRMDAATDLPRQQAEEGSFRDRMKGLMAGMRGREGDARASAGGFMCRMHGH